jgi:predicted O-methyltransferase YrrM
MANKKIKQAIKFAPLQPEAPELISIDEQINDVLDKAKPYKCQQHREELIPFLKLCIERGVKTVLEIGSYDGGLTYIFSELFESVVALDLVHRAKFRKDNVFLINCDTQNLKKDDLEKFDAEFDLIFIDGDHSEKGVTNDYNTFKEMLSPIGIMAFHDIKNDIDNVIPGKSHKDYKCFVSEFWKKTKKEWDYEEIYSFKDTWMADRVHDMSNFGGIGILKQKTK